METIDNIIDAVIDLMEQLKEAIHKYITEKGDK